MNSRLAIYFAAAAVVSASALAQQAGADQPAEAAADQDVEKAKAVVESCNTYKFDQTAIVETNGKKRRMRVRICGIDAKSDADWVRTLREAIEKVKINPKMPPEAKDEIIAGLNGEIAKFTPAPARSVLVIPSAPSIASNPLAPAAKVVEAPAEYSVLPPLPAPLPAKSAVAAAAIPRLSKVKLKIECFTPGDLGRGGPCTTFQPDTILTVVPGEPVPAGTSLRFLRRGDDRGELQLAQVGKGRSVRMKVPRDLCAGGGTSRVEVEVLRRAGSGESRPQVVDLLGTYDLRC